MSILASHRRPVARTDPSAGGARQSCRWLRLVLALWVLSGATAFATSTDERALPTDEKDPPTASPSAAEADVRHPRRPAPLEEAWRPGKAELDLGQGLIYQLAPAWTERIAERGINYYGWYMISLQNSYGGLEDGSAYAGLFDFGVDLDMERLAGARDMLVHLSGSWASGTNLTNDTGAFTPVNAVFSGQSLRFFEAYIEQSWRRDTLSLRAGRLSIGWEYGLEYDLFTQYLSAGFRLNAFSLDVNDENFSVIPFSNWGARLRWTPNENWRLQGSFMNGYPRDFADDDKHGLDFSFHPDEGSFFIGEASYQWQSTKAKRRAKPGRLPGRVTFGGYYDTGDFAWQDGSGRMSSGLSNVYVILRQKVWEPSTASDRGINLWTSLARSGREEIVPVPGFWSGGLIWTGPSAGRPQDTLALGFAASGFSDLLRPATQETVLEAAYSFYVTSWLTVTPDLQYVVKPGGESNIDNVWIPGVLLYVTF